LKGIHAEGLQQRKREEVKAKKRGYVLKEEVRIDRG
jgi:hypothetical protein